MPHERRYSGLPYLEDSGYPRGEKGLGTEWTEELSRISEQVQPDTSENDGCYVGGTVPLPSQPTLFARDRTNHHEGGCPAESTPILPSLPSLRTIWDKFLEEVKEVESELEPSPALPSHETSTFIIEPLCTSLPGEDEAPAFEEGGRLWCEECLDVEDGLVEGMASHSSCGRPSAGLWLDFPEPPKQRTFNVAPVVCKSLLHQSGDWAATMVKVLQTPMEDDAHLYPHFPHSCISPLIDSTTSPDLTTYPDLTTCPDLIASPDSIDSPRHMDRFSSCSSISVPSSSGSSRSPISSYTRATTPESWQYSRIPNFSYPSRTVRTFVSS